MSEWTVKREGLKSDLSTTVKRCTNIVENDASKFVQFRQFLRQTQIPLRRQKPLDKSAGGRPEHGVASLDHGIPNRCQTMTFPHARFANRDNVRRCLQEGNAFEAFQLQLERLKS